jgi:hypothetical protein
MEKPRKRGRPRKSNIVNRIIGGIATKPKNPENCVEMEHDNPEMFKKIYMSAKHFNPLSIIVCFKPDKIFFLLDTDDENEVIAAINPSRLTHYYCSEAMIGSQKYTNVLNIFKTKKKEHDRINMYIKSQNKLKLNLQFIKSKKKIYSTWTTELLYCENKDFDQIIEKVNLAREYDFNFTIISKDLKDEVTGWKTFIKGDFVNLIKCPNDIITFQFQANENNQQTGFGDTDNMVINCDEEKLYNIKFKYKNLSSIALCCIEKNITFFLSEDSHLVSTSTLDSVDPLVGNFYIITQNLD